MPRSNNWSMQQRDEMLFRNYIRVIKSYGDHATLIPALVKFEKAAEPFNISPDRARRIISRILRSKGKVTNLSLEECDQLLDTLNMLYRRDDEEMINGLNKILVRVGVDKTHEEVKQLVQEFLIR